MPFELPLSIDKDLQMDFVAFFHVAPLFSTGVDNEKVEVDNEKALELTNSIPEQNSKSY